MLQAGPGGHALSLGVSELAQEGEARGRERESLATLEDRPTASRMVRAQPWRQSGRPRGSPRVRRMNGTDLETTLSCHSRPVPFARGNG